MAGYKEQGGPVCTSRVRINIPSLLKLCLSVVISLDSCYRADSHLLLQSAVTFASVIGTLSWINIW
jgi:hypothetical protein